MHSEEQDEFMHKLKVAVKGEMKFRMKIPDVMLNDDIKNSVEYKRYLAKIEGIGIPMAQPRSGSSSKGSGSARIKIVIKTKKKVRTAENVEEETDTRKDDDLNLDDDDSEGEVDEAGQYRKRTLRFVVLQRTTVLRFGSYVLVPAFWFLRFGSCILVPAIWLLRFVQAVAATDDSLAVLDYTTVETPMNMSSENKAHFELEKEAIHLILTGIRDEIYSTVDACQTAQEM
nr:hypothetical protein [Tanacetum cinerariifolium]